MTSGQGREKEDQERTELGASLAQEGGVLGLLLSDPGGPGA